MKKLLFAFAIIASFAVGFSNDAHAQNLTTVSASNITDINGTRLAAGQLCFLITDSQDNPISVSIGGGGQALRRGYCSAVAAGVVTSFTVPTPAATSPAGIYYRVTVKDSSTGQEVLRYTGVTFAGATFNFDNYAPVNLGSFAPLTGNSVSGNLSVTGNVAATGTVTGSNIPGTIPGAGACAANQYVTALNTAAPPTCSSTATGTGVPVQATSPTLVTPNIGAATGTSVNLSGNATVGGTLGVAGTSTLTNINATSLSATTGTPLALLSGSTGTNLSTSWGRAAAEVNLAIPSANGFFFTNSDLAGGDFAIRVSSATNRIYLGAGSAIAPLGISNTGVNFYGSTSGSTAVKASAAASGTLTLPAATDTLVGKATTDTLTNKTLTSPAISDPTITGVTALKRVRANQGSALVVGDVGSLSAGWGSTATVSAVAGNDVIGQITLTSNGTGQAVNASFTLTFHDGTWTTAPLCLVVRSDGNGPSGAMIPNTMTATTATFFFNALPVAGTTYQATFICVGR
jgi:hypothetical protein